MSVVRRLTERTQVGNLSVARFLMVAAPGTMAALTAIPAIAFGWLPMAIAAEHPIGIATSNGSASSMYLSSTTDQSLTHIRQNDERAAGLINITDGELSDLCLGPTFALPLIGRQLWLRFATGKKVDIGQIALAVSGGGAGGLTLPATEMGVGSANPAVSGAPRGGFAATASGTVGFKDLNVGTIGLVLDHGFVLRSLKLGVGIDKADRRSACGSVDAAP